MDQAACVSQSQTVEREHRAQRIERVLDALQDRTVFPHPPVTGTPPAPLQWAIAEFRLELRRLRRSVGSGL